MLFFSSLGLMVAEPFITFNFLTSMISFSVVPDLLNEVKENALEGLHLLLSFLIASDPPSVLFETYLP